MLKERVATCERSLVMDNSKIATYKAHALRPASKRFLRETSVPLFLNTIYILFGLFAQGSSHSESLIAWFLVSTLYHGNAENDRNKSEYWFLGVCTKKMPSDPP